MPYSQVAINITYAAAHILANFQKHYFLKTKNNELHQLHHNPNLFLNINQKEFGKHVPNDGVWNLLLAPFETSGGLILQWSIGVKNVTAGAIRVTNSIQKNEKIKQKKIKNKDNKSTCTILISNFENRFPRCFCVFFFFEIQPACG